MSCVAFDAEIACKYLRTITCFFYSREELEAAATDFIKIHKTSKNKGFDYKKFKIFCYGLIIANYNNSAYHREIEIEQKKRIQ